MAIRNDADFVIIIVIIIIRCITVKRFTPRRSCARIPMQHIIIICRSNEHRVCAHIILFRSLENGCEKKNTQLASSPDIIVPPSPPTHTHEHTHIVITYLYYGWYVCLLI